MTIENGLRLERLLFQRIIGSEDFEEGTKAFGEKRKPVFEGK